jgi:hypothetical protein
MYRFRVGACCACNVLANIIKIKLTQTWALLFVFMSRSFELFYLN